MTSFSSQKTTSNDTYDDKVFNHFEEIADTVRVINRTYKKNSSSHTVNSEEVNNKCEKAIKMRIRDSRYALKNRRTVNKDWKDFNNSSY
jgi:uncharacterized membrane-anchored protein YhcB (DUF1043 family)